MKVVWIIITLFVGFLIGFSYEPKPSVEECLSVCVESIPEYSQDVYCD